MLKKFIATLVMMLLFMPTVSAGDISVYINNDRLQFTPAPRIMEGTTIVPMRDFFEALGATVLWDAKNRTVAALKGNTWVMLQIGSKTAFVNGQYRTLAEPARIIDARTFIPLRFVGEALGENVAWEPISRSIIINSGNKANSGSSANPSAASNPSAPAGPNTAAAPSNPAIPSSPGTSSGNQDSQNTTPGNTGSTAPNTDQTVSGLQQFEAQVVKLVNDERAKHGLGPLKANLKLSQVARLKSEDMRDNRYFAHNSPIHGSPFEMMRRFGISYRTAGENIAAGQAAPEQVVNAWMNSPGHRANILNSNYTEIGVGYAQGGSYRHYWTQMFIRP
jgi:uncharacterized YkwD family protein